MTQSPLSTPSSDNLDELTLQEWPAPVGERPASLGPAKALRVVPDNAHLDGRYPQKPGRPLRQQLLLTILPMALAPLGIAALISYSLTQSRSQAEVTTALKGQSLLASETISQNLQDEFTFNELLAQNPLIYNQARRGAEQAAADRLVARTPADLEATFSQTKLLSPSQSVNDFLIQAAAAEDLGEVIVTDKNGFNVAYSAPTSDFIQSDEAWWQLGRDQTQWVSDPIFDESAGVFGVDISQKMIDPSNGSFLGVIKTFVTALEFEELNTYLANSGIQGSQQVQLLDTSAQTVLVSFSEAGQQVVNSADTQQTLVGGEVIAESAQPATPARTGVTDPEQLQQQLAAAHPIQQVSVTPATLGGTASGTAQDWLVAFVYQGKQYALSTMPGIDWVAVASMDTAEIRQAGREALTIFALLVLALGTIATVITIGLARQLSAPLKELSLTARQVAEGNFDVTASVRGAAESQTLAVTFNSLVSRIQSFLRDQTLNTRRANLAAEITGASISSPEELLKVFDLVVAEARDMLGSERLVVYQFKPDWGGTIVAESNQEGLPSAFKQGLDDPCIPEATRSKYLSDGIFQIDDVATAKLHPEHLNLLKNLKVKSVLGVPVISQRRLYGLLITHYCSTVHPWQVEEIDFLKQLGLQLGLVVDRVTLLNQTQTLAQQQQQITERLQQNALQLLMDVDPVSQGDLTVRARVTEDEIGTVADSYNATIASLRKIVAQVQESSQQVATTTDTSQESVQALSLSAARQAEEILAALERVQVMARSVQLVATNAEKAEAAVRQAAQTVDAGDEAMNRTVDGILAIRETVAETAKKVKRLGESSQKISNVVNLISGFAAQTNMLALNASIEASRAGESGKGFAVVAEEVRELARQSAEATTEIEKLVAGIQAETNAVVTAMESGTEQVVVGTQLVNETRQSLNQITAVSRQISELVESIAAATVEQSQASELVTSTMNQVVGVASQNSQAANQVSEAFEQLRAVARALQAEVGRFKVG